jgi:molybdopterin converting factor small subunit
MTIRVVPFARLREIVGLAVVERSAAEGATVGDAFDALASEFPALAALARSTRFVRDGAFVPRAAPLRDGDELGFLPPYGGG